jgi:16S rRNA (cytidine1402-2'-O)-methyltransferase
VSGLPVDRFCFEGFLPRKSGERARALAMLAGEARTMVFFESVHRLTEALTAMAAAFGPDRPAALCRELTKTYEEVRRGTLADLASWAADEEVRGEITVVISGAVIETAEVDPADLAAEVAALVSDGVERKAAIRQVATRHSLPEAARSYQASL